MTDVLTPEQRRRNMQNIHQKDTSIELCLRKALWKKGYRYRKNVKTLPGKPDIVITKYKIAIFCDSEFFHGKDWEVLKPRLENDEVNKQLLFMGWIVIRFWGKEIMKNTDECVRVIEETVFDIKMEVND